ncbi:MAG TPA: DUF2934 domain-containing protein [Burkholderiales bacterium]|jgi:hypothetical protein|nr:DUF2934 domain-containing protein [Burkholderiales bacterium]
MAKARKPSPASTSRNATTSAKTRGIRESSAQSGKSFEGRTEAEAEAEMLRDPEFSTMSQDSTPAPDPLSPQERRHLIQEAAYRCYQQRGRQQGSPLDDWLKAEGEVDRMLASRTHGGSRAH